MATRAQRSEYPDGRKWAEAVGDRYGWQCVACRLEGLPLSGRVEFDHIIPRAQGGLNDVLNGMPLCPEHHYRRTRNTWQVPISLLDEQQRAYLAMKGWLRVIVVACGPAKDGEDYDKIDLSGRGYRHFVA